MYIYWAEKIPEGLGNNVLKRMADSGLGVLLDEEYLLSKNDAVILDGKKIISYVTFEEWIEWISGDRSIEITDGLTLYEDEVLNNFFEELYKPSDNGLSYAEIVYNSEKPYDKVFDLFYMFVGKTLDKKLQNFEARIDEIKKALEDKTFDWD